jgi:hypothetical protein
VVVTLTVLSLLIFVKQIFKNRQQEEFWRHAVAIIVIFFDVVPCLLLKIATA